MTPCEESQAVQYNEQINYSIRDLHVLDNPVYS